MSNAGTLPPVKLRQRPPTSKSSLPADASINSDNNGRGIRREILRTWLLPATMGLTGATLPGSALVGQGRQLVQPGGAMDPPTGTHSPSLACLQGPP